jgi:hypothetical protein
MGSPGHGIFLSWMATGADYAEAWNLQYQLAGGDEDSIAWAVGIQDLLNERERYPGEHHNARSVYVTATGRIQEATWKPIYWTLGVGNRRFNGPFGGLSVPLDDHLRTALEYDGFQPNVGLAYGVNGDQSDKPFEAIGYFGYSGLERPVVGITFTWHD